MTDVSGAIVVLVIMILVMRRKIIPKLNQLTGLIPREDFS
jgi:hypothetical protein